MKQKVYVEQCLNDKKDCLESATNDSSFHLIRRYQSTFK